MLAWNIEEYGQILHESLPKASFAAAAGFPAQYIPELRKGDPKKLGAVVVCGREMAKVGDWEAPFTLQSISKLLTLLLALSDVGVDAVFSKVDMEPTGDPFNSIVKLETAQTRPLNPMINAGAIVICSLLKGAGSEERLGRILDLLFRITGRQITYNETVYLSEKETGDRNRALAYFLKDTGVLEDSVEDVLDLYFRQCAITVDCEVLAKIGWFLASKGRGFDGSQLVPADLVRLVTTFMVTCGMYNASGRFAIEVGIPAKSGVGGGICALVPERLGIGVFGPALDAKGNSAGGVRLLKELSAAADLSIF